MKNLVGMNNLLAETPGGRPARGGSSIIQFFPRTRDWTPARALGLGERPIELSLLLNFLPSPGDARALARQATARA